MTGCSYDRMEANIVLGDLGNQEERVIPKAIQTVQQKKISRHGQEMLKSIYCCGNINKRAFLQKSALK